MKFFQVQKKILRSNEISYFEMQIFRSVFKNSRDLFDALHTEGLQSCTVLEYIQIEMEVLTGY